MQKIWATAATVWAVLGVTAALAWTQARTTPRRRPRRPRTPRRRPRRAPPSARPRAPPPTRPPARHERPPDGRGLPRMGCDCFAGVTAGAGDARRAARALAAARAEVAACERTLSRFLPDSDLSRVNRGAGASGRGRCAHGRRDPGGARRPPRDRRALRPDDPRAARRGRLRPLVRAAGEARAAPPRAGAPAPRWRSRVNRVRVADGAAIDLGGIAKGWSAGRALAAMREAWPAMPGGLVNLGGDLALSGRAPRTAPGASPWPTRACRAATSRPSSWRAAGWRPRGATAVASAPAGPCTTSSTPPPAGPRPGAAGGHRRGARARPRGGVRHADRGGRPGNGRRGRRRARRPLGAGGAGLRPPGAHRPGPRRVGPGDGSGVVNSLSTLPIAWFVARGAGLVSFGFLTASVWLGLAMSTRLLGNRRQKRLLGLHRTLSWMGLTALGLHAGGPAARPHDRLRAGRRAGPVRGALAPGRRRRRRHLRLAGALSPRPSLPEPDRPEGLAQAPTTRASRPSCWPCSTRSRAARTSPASAGRSSRWSPPARSSGWSSSDPHPRKGTAPHGGPPAAATPARTLVTRSI